MIIYFTEALKHRNCEEDFQNEQSINMEILKKN